MYKCVLLNQGQSEHAIILQAEGIENQVYQMLVGLELYLCLAYPYHTR